MSWFSKKDKGEPYVIPAVFAYTILGDKAKEAVNEFQMGVSNERLNDLATHYKTILKTGKGLLPTPEESNN